MTRDKKGRYAASYAETNPAVREIVASYLNESDIALLEQTTEGGVPLLSAAANIERPAESTEAVSEATENTAETEAQDEKALSETQTAEASPDAVKDAASENSSPENQAGAVAAEADAAVPLPPPALPLPAVRPSVSHGKTFLYDYAESPSDAEEAMADTVQSETIIKNVNMQDEKGVTPLMFAIKGASIDLTRTLIKSGADVNARDKEGWTPLMYAVRTQNDPDLARILIDAGASVRAKNSYGVSSLSLIHI